MSVVDNAGTRELLHEAGLMPTADSTPATSRQEIPPQKAEVDSDAKNDRDEILFNDEGPNANSNVSSEDSIKPINLGPSPRVSITLRIRIVFST